MARMVNQEPVNPAVRRVQLGITLRLLREAVGVRPKAVAETMMWHAAKVTRLEKGEVTISDAEIARVSDLYEVTDEAERERLRQLAAEARRRGRPPRIPDWGQTYVALETAAAEIKVAGGELFPGMMQTEDYARALLSLSQRADEHDVSERVSERIKRGQRITRDDSPTLWVVVSESALYREIGGPSTLRGQLAHARELSRLPHVTFQVLPFASGEYVGVDSPFIILHLADPSATYTYLEGLTDADYLDKPNHTAAYVAAFDKMRVTAASERQSSRMLDRRIADLK